MSIRASHRNELVPIDMCGARPWGNACCLLLSLAVLFVFATQSGCTGMASAGGSNSTGSNAPSSVTITISPGSATLPAGATQQFTANVVGTSNTGVTWDLSGAGCSSATCGTISSRGLYVAPASEPSSQIVTVKATSVADPTKSASASLTIVAVASVMLSISPGSASVPTAGTQLFKATVTGSTNTALSWGLSGVGCNGSSCGTLSNSGSSAVYAAPIVAPAPATVSVVATSVADPTKSVSALVTIIPTVVVTVTPATVSVAPGATQQFTSSVTGTSNTTVTWTLSGTSCGGTTCGTINSSGFYSAPSALPSGDVVIVTATSVADPSESATADVTIAGSSVYYVDNCVIAGSDSNNGTSPSTPWRTIKKVNSSTFIPGDSILFQRTCTWRGTGLQLKTSGSASSPITFGAYGAGALPIISGAKLLTTWTVDGSYYYDATSAQPNQLFVDNKRLAEVAAESSLATGKWWWDSSDGRVYVYDNPFGHAIEASQIANAVRVSTGIQHVVLTNLHFTKANQSGILFGPSDANITINKVTADHCYNAGLQSWTNSATIVNDVIVQNSTFAYNGGNGLELGHIGNWVIQGNDISHNNWDRTQPYTRGIYAGGSDTTNLTIQYNNVHENASHGITCDTCGKGIVIRYNNVWKNGGWGIDIDADNGVSVYYNLSWQNLAGIYVFADANTSMNGMLIYNNTVYGNKNAGIWVEGPSAGSMPNGCTDNIVSNNIAVKTTSGPNLAAYYGCENPGADGSGNIYTYNSLGSQAGNFIQWGGRNGAPVYESTYSSWETAAGNCGFSGCSHSIESSPAFANAAADNFTLASDSSGIDAGSDLGPEYQWGLAPATSWPAAVSTLDQNNYGSGWEIGAFVYVPSTP